MIADAIAQTRPPFHTKLVDSSCGKATLLLASREPKMDTGPGFHLPRPAELKKKNQKLCLFWTQRKILFMLLKSRNMVWSLSPGLYHFLCLTGLSLVWGPWPSSWLSLWAFKQQSKLLWTSWNSFRAYFLYLLGDASTEDWKIMIPI